MPIHFLYYVLPNSDTRADRMGIEFEFEPRRNSPAYRVIPQAVAATFAIFSRHLHLSKLVVVPIAGGLLR